MSIPKEPRQIMINLMYLVLTALLALNVSAEILHAFHVVNSGLDASSAAIGSKNQKTFDAFNKQMENDPERTKPFLDKANRVKLMSDNLYDSIENLKREIIDKSGGLKDSKTGKLMDLQSAPLATLMTEGDLEDDRNLEVPTNIMINKGEGEKLKKNLQNLHDNLLNMVDNPQAKQELESQIPLHISDSLMKSDDGSLKSWTEMNFEMVPTIAAVTLLNKFQNDIRNSEDLMVDYLFKQVNAKTVVVDKIQAEVIAPSNYIMSGQPYKADIFVAAYSSTVNPEVYVGPLNYNVAKKDADGNFQELTVNPVSGGGKKIDVINGMGKYSTVASGEGVQKYSGAIMVLGPDGKPRYYPFESEYQSAKGSAIVSSDNLNIIYAGIPNPFSVSVPGFPADKVFASSSGGSFSKTSSGKFSAEMPSSMIGQKVNINVGVQLEGANRQIGASEFLVKRIPDPIAQVNGKFEGDISSAELKASLGVGAQLKDFYFNGVNFSVVSFDCLYIPKRQDPKLASNAGAKFNGQVAVFIQSCHPGDIIYFRNIKAIGPDKTTRGLNSVTFQIK